MSALQDAQPGIEAIEYWLPDQVVTNEDLAREFCDWDPKKAWRATGIRERRVGPEPASDMAVQAAEKLFSLHSVDRSSIDFLLLVTQSRDYPMPATACIVQDKLGLPTSCGALDVTLGCSGYVYGLFMAKALLALGGCRRVLLITVEKISHLHPADRSTRVLLGEGATATLLSASNPIASIGNFDLGTDGRGYANLFVPAGGTALPHSPETARSVVDPAGNLHSQDTLFMDGMEIFSFSVREAPKTFRAALEKNGMTREDIALFVFHQANRMILETLRAKLDIDPSRFCIDLERVGNTSSCSIPIALRNRMDALKPGDNVLLCGFGIGYSWGSTVLKWRRSHD